ncbi:hypothetical protein BDP27DRAFT_1367036 [Rhodocollybia butyracea]|uniref:Uncharacterized protein n=1 Tax=Rhodocollybia butyracea TaxID=206335 RepID=A0A9P5PLA6_9AGAR|nr:hypothetical protein BDP27DRAFT_1367036 [Rhodocollybia butyracea]
MPRPKKKNLSAARRVEKEESWLPKSGDQKRVKVDHDEVATLTSEVAGLRWEVGTMREEMMLERNRAHNIRRLIDAVDGLREELAELRPRKPKLKGKDGKGKEKEKPKERPREDEDDEE